MIEFAQAVEITMANLVSGKQGINLLENATGKILANDIFNDRDTPPFNKSAVDGYAFSLGSYSGIPMGILETIPAGKAPLQKMREGFCSKIMTGAMVPEDADCVVMVEDTYCTNGKVTIEQPKKGVSKWDNICLKGEDLRQGQLLLSKGTLLRPEHIAVLASAGIWQVPVIEYPSAAILSTGDELKEPAETVEYYQIRNSNGWQLLSQAKRAGFKATYMGIAPDSASGLEKSISAAMDKHDVVVMTGGVSMGEFDFVPDVLTSLGFEIMFDRVAVQPGKPSTFAVRYGKKVADETASKVVFALPGNPVSSYLQFELLVRPYMVACAGGAYSPLKLHLPLSKPYNRRNTARMAFVPVSVMPDGSCQPVVYNGSAHIHAMTAANGVMTIPCGVTGYNIGEVAEVIFPG